MKRKKKGKRNQIINKRKKSIREIKEKKKGKKERKIRERIKIENI